MTEQELRTLLDQDIVQVAVPGEIYLLTLHPELCTLEQQPATFIGWISAWSTNIGRWIAIDPATVVAAKPLKVDLSHRHSLS